MVFTSQHLSPLRAESFPGKPTAASESHPKAPGFVIEAVAFEEQETGGLFSVTQATPLYRELAISAKQYQNDSPRPGISVSKEPSCQTPAFGKWPTEVCTHWASWPCFQILCPDTVILMWWKRPWGEGRGPQGSPFSWNVWALGFSFPTGMGTVRVLLAHFS